MQLLLEGGGKGWSMKCPGQDTRYWKPGAIFEVKCPNCGHNVEFFKDETTRRCRNCGSRVVNPKMDFGCAAYCRFAEECLGELPPELLAKREDLLKDRVAFEMKRYFKRDFKRIGHAIRVATHAERMVSQEGGDPAVVLSAAYLHEVGVGEPEVEDKGRGSDSGWSGGAVQAREILARLGARDDLIDEVCRIVGRLKRPGAGETVNFRIVHDADLIARLEEEQKKTPGTREKLAMYAESSFLTETGRRMARQVFLNGVKEKEEPRGG